MRNNLRTVVLEHGDSLRTFEGWCVFLTEQNIFIDLIGYLPLAGADISIKKNSPSILHTGSLFKKSYVHEVSPTKESDIYPVPRLITREKIEISPNSDDNFYYLFNFDQHENFSFSSAFDVLISGLVEKPNHSEKYDLLVYASLPFDVPLMIDSHNTICVSPFWILQTAS